MFRVADCPLSPLQNRRGIVDMRLLSTDIAVHGDPIMWSPADTPERVAQQFIASLFGVPQLSVRLAELSQPIATSSRTGSGSGSGTPSFSCTRRCGSPESSATMPSSRRPQNGVAVTVRYGDGSVTLPEDGAANGTSSTALRPGSS